MDVSELPLRAAVDISSENWVFRWGAEKAAPSSQGPQASQSGLQILALGHLLQEFP